MNKGFLYSIKNIIKNPGKTARIFIDGNRVNHYKPIGLTFILAGISSFISYKIVGLKEIISESSATSETLNKPFFQNYMDFVQTYNTFLILLLIPFFALFTRWAFKSWGHNYYEHVVLNSYILSYYIILNLIFVYPLTYFFRDNANLALTISQVASVSFLIILPYFFKNFYSEREFKKIIQRLLIFFVLAFVFGIVLFIIALLGFVFYIRLFSPETLQQFAPKKP